MFDPRSLTTDRRITIAGREISALSREKTIVLALLIQLFIAAFSSFLVVGLASLYDPGSAEGEIEVAVSGEQQEKLMTVMQESEMASGTVYEDEAAALDVFDDGAVNTVVIANNQPTEQGSRIAVDAYVPADSLETTVIISTLREVFSDLERSERTLRAEHIEFTIVDRPTDASGGDNFTEYFTFTYTILIPLLLFLPPFISGSVVVDSVTEELERGTFELLRVAPVSLTDIVDGKAFGMILLAPLQALLWIFLLRLNDIGISHISLLLLFVLSIATITTAVGLLLGLITGSRRSAQLLYSVIVLLLFAGAAILPEHPAGTVAALAVDSATATTFAHVAGFAVLAAGTYALLRWYVGRVDPESL